MQLLLDGSTNTRHGRKVCCVSQHRVNMSTAWCSYQETGQYTGSEDGSRRATAPQQDQAIRVFVRGGKGEAPPERDNTVSTRPLSCPVRNSPAPAPQTSTLSWNVCSIPQYRYLYLHSMSKSPKKQQTSSLTYPSLHWSRHKFTNKTTNC